MSTERNWILPDHRPIRDQAAERGENPPFGKTIAEIRAMGYELGSRTDDFAVYMACPESPTGAITRWRRADAERLIFDGAPQEEIDKVLDGTHFITLFHLRRAGFMRHDRLSDETRAEFTEEPYHFLAGVEPWPSTILREVILPAFIEALQAEHKKATASVDDGARP